MQCNGKLDVKQILNRIWSSHSQDMNKIMWECWDWYSNACFLSYQLDWTDICWLLLGWDSSLIADIVTFITFSALSWSHPTPRIQISIPFYLPTYLKGTAQITAMNCQITNKNRGLLFLRHLIWVMRRHDLTKKYLPTYIPTHLPTYPPTYLPTYVPPLENTLMGL